MKDKIKVQGVEMKLNQIEAFKIIQSINKQTSEFLRGLGNQMFDLHYLENRVDIFIENICRYYGITLKEVKSRNRSKRLIKARHMTCYLLYNTNEFTLNEIG